MTPSPAAARLPSGDAVSGADGPDERSLTHHLLLFFFSWFDTPTVTAAAAVRSGRRIDDGQEPDRRWPGATPRPTDTFLEVRHGKESEREESQERARNQQQPQCVSGRPGN